MPLPIHVASSSGNRNLLKRLIESVAPQALEVKSEFGKTPLMLAVLSNNSDCASLLLKAGVHVDNTDSAGQTSLHAATNKGFHKCIKLLLSYNASYQQKDFSGVTPLHLAAIHPNSKCLSAILKVIKPGETDIQDSSKKTALHWCSAYANADHIKLLLFKGANTCIPDDQGKTPLHWAATNPNIGAVECVKVLLEKEGNLINWQDYEGRSALHLAVATGSSEVVRLLVSKEICNIDILDNLFCTPLHWAAKRGLHDKVNILLKKGLYTSADGNGANPLHYAAYYNHAKTVEVFLSRTYISDAGDNDGRSTIMWAAAKCADDVIQMMEQNGADFNSVDKNGFSALHIAALLGHLSTLKLLVKNHIPIDLKDKYGLTALLRACEYGRAKASQLLIDLGADISIKDSDSRSVLHWCAIGGHAYLCQILLQRGVSCNTQDSFGRTPLHYACMKTGYLNCVSVLLESGADPCIVDNEGKLPLHWAILANHSEIVKLLCDYDTDVNSLVLLNDWVSPLDLAVTKSNPKILEVLKMYGGLRVKDIKEISAKKIQQWYQKKKFLQNFHFLKRVSHFYSKALHKEKTAFSIMDKSPINTRIVVNKDLLIVPNLINNDHPTIVGHMYSRTLSEHKNNCNITMKFEEAAVVIQRAWRKYSLKIKFRRMQSIIQKSFRTIHKRIEAEKIWHVKLLSFVNQWG